MLVVYALEKAVYTSMYSRHSKLYVVLNSKVYCIPLTNLLPYLYDFGVIMLGEDSTTFYFYLNGNPLFFKKIAVHLKNTFSILRLMSSEFGLIREIVLTGLGYRFLYRLKRIFIQLGFNHLLSVGFPAGISIEVLNRYIIWVLGANKQLVGILANCIRSIHNSDVYRGRGIRFGNEVLYLKASKRE